MPISSLDHAELTAELAKGTLDYDGADYDRDGEPAPDAKKAKKRHRGEQGQLPFLNSAFLPCLRCEERRPLEKTYRICAFCVEACRKDPVEADYWLHADRGQPESPTAAEPGSAEKILVMRHRLLNGEDLFSPDDERGSPNWRKVDLVGLLSEPIQREAGKTGVERDGARWRARPMHRGVKHELGMFADEEQAVAVVVEFWRDTLKLADNATPEQIEEAREAAQRESRTIAQTEKAAEVAAEVGRGLDGNWEKMLAGAV
jgi:hypothetical protein